MKPAKKDSIPPKKRRSSSRSSFLTKLKERKIIQTLAAFIGGGWLITEFVHWVLIDHYHLPEQSLDITIVTLLCIMVCTITWRWFSTIEKPRKIKVEFIVIPLVILIAAYLDIRFIQHIFKPALEVASEERMAYPLPDKPSIAVLPFTNMSGDPEQEYIGDGLSENIISALSVSSRIFVIARNSTFTYKGKPVKVQQVAEDLGVRYVLEGSVQRSGDRLRVSAQLIDALTGHHLWSEKYDRQMQEIFDLQDEITKKIVASLHVKLTLGEDALRGAKATDNLEAWKYFTRAADLMDNFTKEDNIKARELFEAALKLDPGYVTAWVLLAYTHLFDGQFGWSESPLFSFIHAHEIAQKVVQLDEQSSMAHVLLGTINLGHREYDKAISESKRAISLAPNSTTAHAIFATIMYSSGQFEEAIELMNKAMRLSPHYPAWYLVYLGGSYAQLGRFEEALATYKKLIGPCQRGEFTAWQAPFLLATVYAELGKEKKARAYMAEALKINPRLSIESVKMDYRFFKDPVHLQRLVESCRKAGLPEKPSQAFP